MSGAAAPRPEPRQAAGELAVTFKALGDPVRLRLLSLIASAGPEACVCDLNEAFDLSQPTISHHLKVLREAGLVSSERRGTWVYYRLHPKRSHHSPRCSTPPPCLSEPGCRRPAGRR